MLLSSYDYIVFDLIKCDETNNSIFSFQFFHRPGSVVISDFATLIRSTKVEP